MTTHFVKVLAPIAAAILVATILPATVWAQGFTRTETQRHDLTGTNMEMIVATVEAQPGSALPRHFHYGEETVYVIQGAMIETFEKKQEMLQTGATYINVREVPHGGYKVLGDRPLKILTVHVVDKGKPMTIPVKN